MATQRVPDKKNSNNNFLKLHRKYLVVMVSERIRRNEKEDGLSNYYYISDKCNGVSGDIIRGDGLVHKKPIGFGRVGCYEFILKTPLLGDF